MSVSEVVVVGGGIIGLSIAWRCRQRGLAVTVHDSGGDDGAWYAAAGMLAPAGETGFGQEALTRLLLDSAARWPGFAAELERETGIEVGYDTVGTLSVALTADDLAEARRLWAYRREQGLGVSALLPSALRDLEPALSPRVRGGAHAPEDHQVDPRRVVAALRAALGAAVVRERIETDPAGPDQDPTRSLGVAPGAGLEPGWSAGQSSGTAPSSGTMQGAGAGAGQGSGAVPGLGSGQNAGALPGVVQSAGAVPGAVQRECALHERDAASRTHATAAQGATAGMRLSDLMAAQPGRAVVIAAGAGTAGLTGLPVRPVKGLVLRLRGAPGLLRHVISGWADGRHVYLVPRADGEVVVGATQEERVDTAVTAGQVLDLLRAATDLVPELGESELVEAIVRHRPATPDNAPLLGTAAGGVIVAAGHHRNGVLLAPVTADLIADLVATGKSAALLEPFAPGRFG